MPSSDGVRMNKVSNKVIAERFNDMYALQKPTELSPNGSEPSALPKADNVAEPSNLPRGGEAEHAIANPVPVDTQSSSSEANRSSLVESSMFTPRNKPQAVHIPRFGSRLRIDGRLNDEQWLQAAVIDDFYQIQPGDNIPPSKPTQVLLGYDPSPAKENQDFVTLAAPSLSKCLTYSGAASKLKFLLGQESDSEENL